MITTLYAAFPDGDQAHRAAGALMDSGVPQDHISLVLPESYDTTDARATRTDADGPLGTFDRTTPAAGTEHSRSGEESGIGFDLRHDHDGDVKRMDRADNWVEKTKAAADNVLDGDAFHGRHDDAHHEEARKADYRADDEHVGDYHDDTDAPGSGLTTTTAADAGAGAVKGAGLGAAAGVAAALVSLAVPGVGLVLGGGALATAIGGAVGATAAGAVAGGVYGFLREQGMPADAAEYYQGEIKSGRAILSVAIPTDGPDRAEIVSVLNKYGAANVRSFDGSAYDAAA